MSNKKVILSSGIALLLMGISVSSFASKGVINADTVKMRAEANLESKIVTLVSVDDKVDIIEKTGDWYKAKFEDKTGFIYAKYVTVKEDENKKEENDNAETKENVSEQKLENKQEDSKIQESTNVSFLEFPIEKKINEDVKVKILPLINSNEIFDISKDTKVTVTESINGWCHIFTGNKEGWIRSDKLVDVNQTVEENKSSEKNEKSEERSENKTENKTETSSKGYVNVETVNVRKTASTSSEIITNLNLNDEVTVISEEDNWCKIKKGKVQGYIAKKYISDKKTEIKVTNRSDIDRSNSNVSNGNNESSSIKENIVKYAKQFLGVKYVHGGSSPNGFDCSGFTSYVYKNFGYSLSRSSTGQINNGRAVNKSEIELGDIVVFNNSANSSVGHVGIYIGNNEFIHASSPGDVVKITSLSMDYYKKRFVAVRRII